jgi:hypothetical protein
MDSLKKTLRRSALPPCIVRLLVFPKPHKTRVPKVIVGGPFYKFKLPNEHRLQPQCRMPDYAASGVASVVITVFSVILFRHSQTEDASTESCPVFSCQ